MFSFVHGLVVSQTKARFHCYLYLCGIIGNESRVSHIVNMSFTTELLIIIVEELSIL